jgi:NAD(P)-dependent dehydrogenase (short-subunit alcohol dehydrogenase family)
MGNRLEGRVAVVTGGGRGIGRGIALLLAEEGANVVVNDYGVAVDGTQPTSGPAQEVVDEIKSKGGDAVPNADTVATLQGGEAIIQTALDTFGRLDILINVAGILRDRMVFNMTEQEWDDVIAVHLKGHFNTTKPASIIMRQQRSGRIINYSSTSGLIGNPGQVNYGAAKAAIAGFSRVVARDLGRYGVTCNYIAPGAATRMTASVPEASRQLRARAGIQGAASTTAAESQGLPPLVLREPEYVAPMTVFLATDKAWNINGQGFGVSGGTVSLLTQPLPYRTMYKPGMWTLDELERDVPTQLMQGIPNPAPPPADLEIAGRPKPEAASV